MYCITGPSSFVGLYHTSGLGTRLEPTDMSHHNSCISKTWSGTFFLQKAVVWQRRYIQHTCEASEYMIGLAR